MTPQELLRALPPTPYIKNGRTINGLDCFGLIEVWHREILGIEIDDRSVHESNPEGFNAGYDTQSDWVKLEEPEDHCVIVMRTAVGRRIFEYGHCGIFYNGFVLHMEDGQGFKCEKWSDRQISSRCTDIRKHTLANSQD